MNRLIFFLAGLLLWPGCRHDSIPPERQLRVGANGATLYAQPGPAAGPLLQLTPGQIIADQGMVSNFVSPLRFGGALYEAPWLRVEQVGGPVGWVFAAAVTPVQGDAADWLLEKRLDCFVGPALRVQCRQWQASLDELKTADDVATAYHRATRLRDDVLQRLHARAEPNEAGFEPDVFWLSDALPGFIVQQVPAARSGRPDSSGRVPWLFFDYRTWQRRAAQSAEPSDDTFFQLCALAYPADSIESFFPVWTIQTAERSGSSQLGSGRHQELLTAIEAALAAETPFKPDLLALKDRLIDDIVNGHNSYWQTVERILTELNLIMEKDFSCLNERDRLALEERRAQFESAEANGLPVNLRGGR